MGPSEGDLWDPYWVPACVEVPGGILAAWVAYSSQASWHRVGDLALACPLAGPGSVEALGIAACKSNNVENYVTYYLISFFFKIKFQIILV